MFAFLKKNVVLLGFYCILCLLSPLLPAQPATSSSLQRGEAEKEFRRGVQTYYRGAYNDAILQFEKALSYLPDELLIIEWLGRAYYKAGVEGTALKQWQYAVDKGYGGLLLKNRIDFIQSRRIKTNTNLLTKEYTEASTFSGKINETLYFSKPISLLSLHNGSFLFTAFGSNEIVTMDANGNIQDRWHGPLVGFDRPWGIIEQKEGTFIISEYGGNRLSQLDAKGNFIKSFGEKGINDAKLLGPQFLAQDNSGNIYVSDFGNGYIAVYSADGKPLFNFGSFIAPSGIAIYSERIFVADSLKGSIQVFDLAGNFLETLVPTGMLQNPESLSIQFDQLIVPTGNKVVTVNINTGAITTLGSLGNAPTRLTSAQFDANKNIIATDFLNNGIFVLSSIEELAGGLFVNIERVYADNFPNVIVNVKVQNRQGLPVVGLKASNFFLTEEKRPVTNVRYIGAADNENTADITIIIDKRLQNRKYTDSINSAVQNIAKSMQNKGKLSIISVADIPLLEYSGSPQILEKFSYVNLKNTSSSGFAIDTALRLAANTLIKGSLKRGIIYLSANPPEINSFQKYGLTEITAYLNNNSISFNTITLNNATVSKEFEYIMTETFGKKYYIFRPQGISMIVADIQKIPVGVYQLSYQSSLPTDFGRAFLPVETEVYLLNRSGRDEIGYFSPLQ